MDANGPPGLAARTVATIWAIAMIVLYTASCFADAAPPGQPILRIETDMHTDLIRAMATDREGRHIVTASLDKTVRLWDAGTGNLVRVLRPPIGDGSEGALYAVAMSPDGATVACGGWTGVEWEDRSVYIFDAATGGLKKRLTGLRGVVQGLAFSKDGRHLLVVSRERGGLAIYETFAYRLVARDPRFTDDCLSVEFAPSGSGNARLRFVLAAGKGGLRLYEYLPEGSGMGQLSLIQQVRPPDGSQPFSAAFSADGSKIAVGYAETPKVDVLSSGDLSHIYSPETTGIPRGRMTCVSWSGDGTSLYASGQWFAPGEGVFVRRWSGDGRGPALDTPVGWAPVMRMLAVGTRGVALTTGDVAWVLLDRDNRRAIHRTSSTIDFRHHPKGLFVSPDGSTVKFFFDRGPRHTGVFSVTRSVLYTGPEKRFMKALKPPIVARDGIEVTDWAGSKLPHINGSPVRLDRLEQSRAAAVSPATKEVLIGGTKHLYLFSEKGEVVWKRAVAGGAHAVNVAGNGRIAVAALGEGTIGWYRMNDGTPLLSLFPHYDRKRWVLWTPSGYYDAEEDSGDLIGWHVNQGKDKEARFYPLANFFERFFAPNVTAGAIESMQDAGRAVDSSFKLPPKISIVAPADKTVAEEEQATLKVVAEDLGGGIDEVRLYHNGKVVPVEQGTVAAVPGVARMEVIFRVVLVEGENRFIAQGVSKDRVEGNGEEIVVTLKAPEKRARLYLLLVGIDKYRNPALNLNFAESDARSVGQFFSAPNASKLYSDVRIFAATNEKATRDGIAALFKKVRDEVGLKDVIVLFMAGHGDIVDGEWYFIPHEVATPEVDEDVKAGALSSKRIMEELKGLKAQKIFVLIDACKSGGMVQAAGGLRGIEDRKVLKQLARSSGVYLMSASTEQQLAAEVKELGHGVFTFSLLEGLNGKAGDKKVTVERLVQYVKERLPELTEKYRGSPQWPVSWGTGTDFPLVVR